jgi:hypothetical protein
MRREAGRHIEIEVDGQVTEPGPSLSEENRQLKAQVESLLAGRLVLELAIRLLEKKVREQGQELRKQAQELNFCYRELKQAGFYTYSVQWSDEQVRTLVEPSGSIREEDLEYIAKLSDEPEMSDYDIYRLQEGLPGDSPR